jgi:hypothetical protein
MSNRRVKFNSQSVFHESPGQMLCGKGVLLLNKCGTPCIPYPHWKFITKGLEKSWDGGGEPVPTADFITKSFGVLLFLVGHILHFGGSFGKHISQKP